MLSKDIQKLEDWWRAVLLGSHDCTPEACEAFLNALMDARVRAQEQEQYLVPEPLRQAELKSRDDNVVVFTPAVRNGGRNKRPQADGGDAA